MSDFASSSSARISSARMSRSASLYLTSRSTLQTVLGIERQCYFISLSKRLESKLAFRLLVRSFFLWRKKMSASNDDLRDLETRFPNTHEDESLDSGDELDELFSASLDTLFLHKKRILSDDNRGRLRRAFVKIVNNPPDLKCLGPMPVVLKPHFRANGHVLWALYIAYCTNPRNFLQNSSLTKQLKHRKKLLEFDCLWKMLRDFDICPHFCSQNRLKELLLDVMAHSGVDSGLPSPERPVKSSPGEGSPEKTSTEVFLSYDHFLKLLWRLALDCMVVSELASAPVRLKYLFVRMDTSGGWQKVRGVNNLRLT